MKASPLHIGMHDAPDAVGTRIAEELCVYCTTDAAIADSDGPTQEITKSMHKQKYLFNLATCLRRSDIEQSPLCNLLRSASAICGRSKMTAFEPSRSVRDPRSSAPSRGV